MRVDWAGDLPPELAELVRRSVDRSRLREPVATIVSRELAAHMRDALERGRPVTRVIEEFGDPEVTGLLIRRARAPRRGQAHRLTVVAAALGAVIVLSAYGVSARTLHAGVPAVTLDPATVAEIAELQTAPVDLAAAMTLVERLVGQMYTDDGAGNGTLTARGLRIVQRLKGIAEPSPSALVVEPIYFAFPARRRDVMREARHVLQLAHLARRDGVSSQAWRAFEGEVERFSWSNVDGFRYVPLAIVLPRLSSAIRQEARTTVTR